MRNRPLAQPTSTVRTCLMVLVLAILLAACSGNGTPDSGTPDDGAEDVLRTTATASTLDSGATTNSLAAGDTSLPLSELYGYDHTSPKDVHRYFAELQAENDEIVAACMRRQGFEYTPFTYTEVSRFTYGETDLVQFSDEWVERYGFGVSTLRWSQEQVGDDVVGYPSINGQGSGSNSLDPNDEHTNNLSEAQHQAWKEALNGPRQPFDPDATQAAPPQGCIGEGWEQVYAPMDEVWATFGDELHTVYDRVEADPRTIQHYRQINDCVGEAGFQWDSSQEPWDYFEPQLRGIGAELDNFVGPDDLAAMSEEQAQAWSEGATVLSETDRATLAEIQAEELMLAQIVAGCGGAHQDQVEALHAIYTQYEQEFVDQNQAELASFLSN